LPHTDHPSYCILAYNSLSLDGPGRPRLCCNNHGHWKDFANPFVTDVSQPLDVLNSPLHKAVRQSIALGQRHPSCSKCWQIEDTGGTSFRQIWNGVYGDLGETLAPRPTAADGTLLQGSDIQYLDITFGNKCNLVCRMCNWANSHLWTIDNIKLGRHDSHADQRAVHQQWFEDPRAMEIIYSTLHTVTHINFLGGEPLIIKQHHDILEECVRHDLAQRMRISYNTNLTHMNPRLLELWQQFGHVTVNVSLEAFGRANDYLRQNSSWADIMRNLRALLRLTKHQDSMTVDIHATFGLYNCLSAAELITWCRQRQGLGGLPFVNVVYHPSYQDVRLLPDSAKRSVRDQILAALEGMEQHQYHASWMAALNHMDQSSDLVVAQPRTGWPEDPWQQFWHDAGEIDQLKHRAMADYLPSLWELRP
jgi:molybdenum cofactor biosynthesis enzyme MoaA